MLDRRKQRDAYKILVAKALTGNESMDGRTRFGHLLLMCVLLSTVGCTSGITTRRANVLTDAIPAHRLPDSMKPPRRDNLIPIDFTTLRPLPNEIHLIGPGDVLGVYIREILDGSKPLPEVSYSTAPGMKPPAVGHPIEIRADGTLPLPLLADPLKVEGLTLAEAEQAIVEAYIALGILNEERAVVGINIIKPRSIGVYVLREDDASTGAAVIGSGIRRQSSFVELPIYENDVLRALIASGGLPASDAYNELWILRGGVRDDVLQAQILQRLQEGQDPADFVSEMGTSFVRIPLRLCPGQPLPFSPNDVILNDGDIIFIESREREFFITGGLIRGAKFEIPRDRDLDILEAMAIANANIDGPAGNATATLFRSGPGNIIPPSRVIVVRTLPTGEQVKILVDLKAALNDPNERINLMSRDLVLLKYKPREILSNIALNYINVGFAIPNN